MKQINYLDYSLSKTDTNVVKGIAICAMLWHHLFYLTSEYGELVHVLGLMGKVCVSLFLFVSAYGLTIQYTTNTENDGFLHEIKFSIKFLLKRFVKFYANYWVIFVLCVPIGILLGRSFTDAYGSNLIKCFILDIFGMQGYSSYNITWWFNKLIILLYICFPFLYQLTRKWYVVIPTILFLLLWTKFPIFKIYDMNMFTFHFVLGIVVAINIDKISYILNKFDVRLVLISSLILCILCLVNRQYAFVPYITGVRMDAFLSPIIALLVVCINHLLNSNIVSICFTFLGKHSMNIYMVHTFIFYYFFNDFIYGFKYPIIIFAVLLLLSLVLSIAIEFVKNKLGFYKAIKYLTSKL